MTFTEAKRELKSYGRILREEQDVLVEIDRLKTKCTKVTTTYSDMPKGSYNVHKLENAIADLLEENDKYFKLLDEEMTAKATIKHKLELIEDSNYNFRVLLNKRFILQKSIYEISKDLNYTERHTIRLINLAIKEYAKI